MADTAAHLEERVLPRVPIRHWIRSLPRGLRALLGYDASESPTGDDRKLCSEVVSAFMTEVRRSLRWRAKTTVRARQCTQPATWCAGRGAAHGQCSPTQRTHARPGARRRVAREHAEIAEHLKAQGRESARATRRDRRRSALTQALGLAARAMYTRPATRGAGAELQFVARRKVSRVDALWCRFRQELLPEENSITLLHDAAQSPYSAALVVSRSSAWSQSTANAMDEQRGGRVFERVPADLVPRIVAGDEDAAIELVQRYQGLVAKLLLHVLGPHDELQDHIQDVLADVLAGVHQLRNPEALTVWIQRVAVSRAKNILRARQRRRWLLLRPPAELPERATHDDVDAREDLQQLYRVLDELDPCLKSRNRKTRCQAFSTLPV